MGPKSLTVHNYKLEFKYASSFFSMIFFSRDDYSIIVEKLVKRVAYIFSENSFTQKMGLFMLHREHSKGITKKLRHAHKKNARLFTRSTSHENDNKIS